MRTDDAQLAGNAQVRPDAPGGRADLTLSAPGASAVVKGELQPTTVAGTLRRNLYLDRTMQWTTDHENAIRALTLEQVNAAIPRHLKPETLSVFVAGDFAKTATAAPASK